ncbi:MAG: hypothetical protein M1827_000197 [Pycnora praestabilis]|nr:MAG: hypothetical protein M1827_000197 [Pycnora praestabilis]
MEVRQAPSPSKASKSHHKKPYHIKKADLHLDEYKQEQASRSPSILLKRAVNALKTSRQFHSFVALQIVAALIGYGQVMLVVGLMWAMIANTGKRKEGEMSAYSLFNEGVEGIEGSTDMQALEQELRTTGF